MIVAESSDLTLPFETGPPTVHHFRSPTFASISGADGELERAPDKGTARVLSS